MARLTLDCTISDNSIGDIGCLEFAFFDSYLFRVYEWKGYVPVTYFTAFIYGGMTSSMTLHAEVSGDQLPIFVQAFIQFRSTIWSSRAVSCVPQGPAIWSVSLSKVEDPIECTRARSSSSQCIGTLKVYILRRWVTPSPTTNEDVKKASKEHSLESNPEARFNSM